MAVEREPTDPAPVEAIHYYPKHKSLVVQVEGGLTFALIHQPDGIFYELIREGSLTQRSVEQLMGEAQVAESPTPHSPTPAATSKERSPTTVLAGKLNTKPQEGRPDRHQKPTAWAQFLAHIEGRDEATLLSTSFHGKTRALALQLDAGDRITAQGYLHLRQAEEGRLPTFSVIHLLHYPGKEARDGS